MNKELNEYVELFFSYDNTVYYSIILVLSLFVLVYVFYKYIILPLQKKHLLEKQELELKNARLMALFAELDPDPVIRIDTAGKIIHSNDAARKLNNSIELEGKNVREILPQINFPVADYIKNNQTQNFFHAINGKYYSILFRGTSYLDIAQIYFRDLTERKKFEEELEESRKRLKDLSAHLQDKLEEERQRISRELHDSVGQNLLLIKLKLQNIDLNFIKSAEKAGYFNLIETLENSIKELKSISYDLKPRILEEMGLGPALTSLCNKISKESGIKGSIEFVNLNDERFNSKMEISI
jgi:signal transduction histidine kinase